MVDISEEKIKFWLKSALKNENLSGFSVSKVGNTEVGEGYVGDIVFVKVTTDSARNYNLVLKCSKDSQTLRQAMPVKETFENEIHFYANIVPAFVNFQKRKSSQIFESVPKYYGCYVCDNQEVIALEDLKMKDYYLCDRKSPLPTDHLKLVLQEHGKYHAISAAFQDQEPETFKKLVDGIPNVWKMFADKTDPESFFGPPIEEVYDLLKDDLDATIAERLKNFPFQIEHVMKDLIQDTSCFSVITHGDCWSNNHMFKKEIDNDGLKVAILDWQALKFFSPVMDLSYLIYACSSEQDLHNFERLLRDYYDSFSNFVRILGSDPNKLFSFSQLLQDFEAYGKYGVIMAFLSVKVALSDKDEAPDFSETSKVSFADTFYFKNKDQPLLKNRMLYLVKHMAKHNLL